MSPMALKHFVEAEGAVEKEFVLIYDLQTQQKKLMSSRKKGLPLEPRNVGMRTFSTKIFETRAV
jgi:hypothetical protein